MNFLPLPLVDDTFLIDNSGFETTTTCDRSAEYYLLNKRERSGDRVALKFGGIVHKILEARYRSGGSAINDTAKAAMLQAALQGFSDTLDDSGNLISGYSPPEGDHRNYDMAIDIIQEYCSTYSVEPFEVMNLGSKHAIEIPFAHPLFDYEINRTIWVREVDGTIRERYVGTIRVLWQGRCDLIVQNSSGIYGVDHKTTSMMGPTYFKEFELASQFRGYTWATQQLLGVMPKGFIVNALGIRKPTKTGKKIELQRKTIDISQDNLDEWQQDTIHSITSFIEGTIAGFHPRKTKWCMGKYGACQYFDVCTLPRNQRATMLSTGDFKDVTWDPLKGED